RTRAATHEQSRMISPPWCSSRLKLPTRCSIGQLSWPHFLNPCGAWPLMRQRENALAKCPAICHPVTSLGGRASSPATGAAF
ncbi:MAG TPA: hypothetical protein VGC80_16180, partial [Acetobacteraceae bacterium]